MGATPSDPTADTRTAVVIEDDADIRDLVTAVFEQSGFTVHGTGHGVTGIDMVRDCDPEVVTLDLGLPGIDGFEVAQRIRQFSDCYIIMLTARTDETDAIMGLNAGADDFLTKPFRPRELRARIAAMLRRPRNSGAEPMESRSSTGHLRTGGIADPTEPSAELSGAEAVSGADPRMVSDTSSPKSGPRHDDTGVATHSGLRVDNVTRSVSFQGNPVELTRTEFDLLFTLMETGRRVRTKADLVRHLRQDYVGSDSYVSVADERTVEVHVGNLRRKLSAVAAQANIIETVRGVGYRTSVQNH